MKQIIKITLLIALVMNVVIFPTHALEYDTHMRDSILSEISGATISTQVINVQQYGAIGDGKHNCKPAFDKAIKKATRQGGARILVPAGTYYLCGPIHLQSNICLEIQEGATLKFSPDPTYYPIVNTSWEGTRLYNYSPFIYAFNASNIAIIGKGNIDGNAMSTFATWRDKQRPDLQSSRNMNHEETAIESRIYGEGHYLRPQLIQFYQCKDITLEDVFITNSPFWCIHLLQSENIICRSLRYDAKLVNNDGIDPESSRNILIEDIHFNNGDDNIAIKSGRDHDGRSLAMPSENIIIRRCHFKGLHAVVIGSEMSGGVQNIFVEDCDYAGYCKRGIYIKTNPDRGGFIRNIFVKNCQFGEVEDLFYATSMYAGEGLENHYFTKVENIYLDGISCQRVNKAALVLQGTIKEPIRNVIFKNIEIESAPNAISFDHTESVSLENIHIGGKAGVPTQVSQKDNLFGR
ncbi:MAG: glycoside hydrolase family 28 protein [Paludibacteraceae bacterium]|nr:glycoside hydrolase family 28 protein [Paludibacteraceae bacterium]